MTPPKSPKTKREIKRLKLDFSYENDCYIIDRHLDQNSRIDILAEKINEIIDWINKHED